MQRDAIERLDLQRLLLEPEMLEAIEPDIHLVSTLLELQHLLPDTTRATARMVVGKVVAQIQDRLGQPTLQAVSGALARQHAHAASAARPTSTGTAPSEPTCATTSHRSAPSCPSGWSATRGVGPACARS